MSLLHRRLIYSNVLPKFMAVAASHSQSRCNAHQVQPNSTAAQAPHTAGKDSTVHCCSALCCWAAVHNACLHVLAWWGCKGSAARHEGLPETTKRRRPSQLDRRTRRVNQGRSCCSGGHWRAPAGGQRVNDGGRNLCLPGPHAGASSGHGLATKDVRAGIMMHTLVCLLAASEYVQSMSCPSHALGGYKLDPAWRMGCRGRQHTGCM